jgi:lysophospholipid acyltransferase (LPLAT)-like uncharacterized protein
LEIVRRTFQVRVLNLNRIVEYQNQGILWIAWHSDLVAFVTFYRFFFPNRKICFWVVDDWPHYYYAPWLKISRWDEVMVNSKNKEKAAQLMADALASGKDAVIFPDGPYGPSNRPKPGIYYVAIQSNSPIVPVTFSFSLMMKLQRWDHLKIPVPFVTEYCIIGKPLISPDNSNLSSFLVDVSNNLNQLQVELESSGTCK